MIKDAELYLLSRLKRMSVYIIEHYVRGKGRNLALPLVNALRLEESFLLFINIMDAYSPYIRLGDNRKSMCIAARWAITGELKPEDIKILAKLPTPCPQMRKER